MELDELKALWAQSNRKLEESMRLNTMLLQQTNLQRAENSLKRLARGITAELLLTFIVIVLIGGFAADNLREPAFLVPAILLDVCAIVLFAAGLRQLAEMNAVDYDEPVVVIQKKLEDLRVRRIRTTLGALLFGPLMWLPMLIVALRGFFGVDLYVAASPAWLVANVLFGLAVIPIAIAIARRAGPRLKRSSALRAIADDIAGRSLAAALNDLDTLRRFEAEA